jgi:hypothetical protein
MMSSDAGRVRSTILILIAVVAVGAAGVFYLTRQGDETPAEPSVPHAEPGDEGGAAPIHAGGGTEADAAPPTVVSGTAAPESAEQELGQPDAQPDAPEITKERTPSGADVPRSYTESPSSSATRGTSADDARGSVSSRSATGAGGGAVADASAQDRLSGSAPAGSRADTLTVYPGGSSRTGPATTRPPETPQQEESLEAAPQQTVSEPSSYTPADDPLETPPVSSIPTVRMVASAGYVSVGELVTVLVTIDGATDVGHTPFHVLYNPAVLRFVAGDEGGFLGSDGQQTAFFATATSDGASVVVGLSRLGRVPGVSGSGELCQLHFEVVGPGNAGLAFSRAKVRDSSNRIVSAIFELANIIGS